jgi:hyperosmotically inducible periplasmic protein
MRTPAMILSTSLLVSALIASVVAGSAFAQATQNIAADNSAQNQRDRNHQNLTPLDQSNKPADLEMTRNIRRALVKDDQLSTEAKNIKIITVNGAVTLRGPVKTDQEKAAVMEKAAQVAGDTNIHGQLQVARQ